MFLLPFPLEVYMYIFISTIGLILRSKIVIINLFFVFIIQFDWFHGTELLLLILLLYRLFSCLFVCFHFFFSFQRFLPNYFVFCFQ